MIAVLNSPPYAEVFGIPKTVSKSAAEYNKNSTAPVENVGMYEHVEHKKKLKYTFHFRYRRYILTFFLPQIQKIC